MTLAQFQPQSLRKCLAEMCCSRDLSLQISGEGFAFPIHPLLLLNGSPFGHSFPICFPGRCSLFTFFARGVNHSSPRGHQVDPTATNSSSSSHPPHPALRHIPH